VSVALVEELVTHLNGARVEMESRFTGNASKCSAPYLSGTFQPRVLTVLRTTDVNASFGIFGEQRLLPAFDSGHFKLWPPNSWQPQEYCLFSQTNGGEAQNSVLVSESSPTLAVFMISTAVVSSSSVEDDYLFYLEVYGDGVTNTETIPIGAFHGSTTPVTIDRTLVHKYSSPDVKYVLRVVDRKIFDFLTKEYLIGTFVVGDTPTSVTGEVGKSATMTVELTVTWAKDMGEAREVESDGSTSLFTSTLPRLGAYSVIEHSGEQPYHLVPAVFFDDSCIESSCQEANLYEARVPLEVRFVELNSRAGYGVFVDTDTRINATFFAQEKGTTTQRIISRFVSPWLPFGQNRTAEDLGLTTWGLRIDPTMYDLYLDMYIEIRLDVDTRGYFTWTSEKLLSLGETPTEEASLYPLWFRQGKNDESRFTFSFRPSAAQVAVSGLAEGTSRRIVCRDYFLRNQTAAGTSDVYRIDIEANNGYGVMWWKMQSDDGSDVLRGNNKMIVKCVGMTPLSPHRWLAEGEALLDINESMIMIHHAIAGVVIPFRVNHVANTTQSIEVQLIAMFRGDDDGVCKPDMELIGTGDDLFGCVEYANKVARYWKALATPAGPLENPLRPTNIQGTGWALHGFDFGGAADEPTTCSIRQTQYTFFDDSPFLTLTNLKVGVSVLIEADRAEAIGLWSALGTAEAGKAMLFTPTYPTETFVAYGSPGTANVLWSIPLEMCGQGLAVVMQAPTAQETVSGVIDVNWDGVGTFAQPGARLTVIADRDADAWFYSRAPGRVKIYNFSAEAPVTVTILYEPLGADHVTITAFAEGDLKIPFSWKKLSSSERPSPLYQWLMVNPSMEAPLFVVNGDGGVTVPRQQLEGVIDRTIAEVNDFLELPEEEVKTVKRSYPAELHPWSPPTLEWSGAAPDPLTFTRAELAAAGIPVVLKIAGGDADQALELRVSLDAEDALPIEAQRGDAVDVLIPPEFFVGDGLNRGKHVLALQINDGIGNSYPLELVYYVATHPTLAIVGDASLGFFPSTGPNVVVTVALKIESLDVPPPTLALWFSIDDGAYASLYATIPRGEVVTVEIPPTVFVLGAGEHTLSFEVRDGVLSSAPVAFKYTIAKAPVLRWTGGTLGPFVTPPATAQVLEFTIENLRPHMWLEYSFAAGEWTAYPVALTDVVSVELPASAFAAATSVGSHFALFIIGGADQSNVVRVDFVVHDPGDDDNEVLQSSNDAEPAAVTSGDAPANTRKLAPIIAGVVVGVVVLAAAAAAVVIIWRKKHAEPSDGEPTMDKTLL
jgi:hypothetical protein